MVKRGNIHIELILILQLPASRLALPLATSDLRVSSSRKVKANIYMAMLIC
tara:strand:+ start:442 stop:594 length:153 start_codon:yes stop_codon:yes gene_type:complete